MPSNNDPDQLSMNNNNEILCSALLAAESEEEVIGFLTDAGYWNDTSSWRDFGDRENNYSIIGAQQAKQAYALVEKIVNSVDAVLMRECLRQGVIPDSKNAPSSIAKAVDQYFGITDGNLANITALERSDLAANIGLIASGKKTQPNLTVFDLGEGQRPSQMPHTFLSLTESNKLRIPFVQGKFNMGGSGVLRFSGNRSINLVVSKRDPRISGDFDDADLWGFSVIRREDPTKGRKNSVYTYLAPNREILTFRKDKVSLPNYSVGTQDLPSLEWGSIIKLYEYELPGGLKTNILFDLYNEISLLLTRAALPVRFYERRNYSGHSLETTMAGLHVRLEEDKRENLEPGFPSGFQFNVMGEPFTGQIFAFKKDPGEKKSRAEKYKHSEGILFTSNGQTHGDISQSFFARNRVGMSYLADSLLVIVECDGISGRGREILFMNSRDRLSDSELRRGIEKEIEGIISSHPGLRALRERRRREMVDSKLGDSKPLREVLNQILSKSPALAALFTRGADLPNPFKSRLVGEEETYEGLAHPTFFRLVPNHKSKTCHINMRFRLDFETDVVNDYFERDRYPGELTVVLDGKKTDDFSRHLWNGLAHITIALLEGVRIGDTIRGTVTVNDETLIDPFRNEFEIHVLGEIESSGNGGTRRPPRGNGKGDRLAPDDISLPKVNKVREDRWDEFGFDRFSALKVIYTGDKAYDFHLNMDNVFLRTELKKTNRDDLSRLLEARFEYGMVLLGLALLKDREVFEDVDSEENQVMPIEQLVELTSRSVAPFILPMIEALGALELEDVVEQPESDLELDLVET